MTKHPLPLMTYTQEQWTQAQARFELLRPFLEDGIPFVTKRTTVFASKIGDEAYEKVKTLFSYRGLH